MPRKDLINSDQTSFVDQAPLWQKTAQNKLDLKNNLRGNRNLRPFYLLLMILFMVFLLYFLLILTRNNTRPEQNLIDRSEQIDRKQTPLEKRVNDLKVELELADPNRQSLPFPNVDLELSFD